MKGSFSQRERDCEHSKKIARVYIPTLALWIFLQFSTQMTLTLGAMVKDQMRLTTVIQDLLSKLRMENLFRAAALATTQKKQAEPLVGNEVQQGIKDLKKLKDSLG